MKAKPPADLTPYEKQVLYLVDRRVAVEVSRSLEKLKPKSAAWAAYAPFETLKPKPLQPAFVATDAGPVSPPTKLKSRKGEAEVKPGFLTILAPGELTIEPMKERHSTGRRTALANWITDPANPLSTRVIVNRVWQYHFGSMLSTVATIRPVVQGHHSACAFRVHAPHAWLQQNVFVEPPLIFRCWISGCLPVLYRPLRQCLQMFALRQGTMDNL